MPRYKGSDHTNLFWILLAGAVVVLLAFYVTRSNGPLPDAMPPAVLGPSIVPSPTPGPLAPEIPEAPVTPGNPPEPMAPSIPAAPIQPGQSQL